MIMLENSVEDRDFCGNTGVHTKPGPTFSKEALAQVSFPESNAETFSIQKYFETSESLPLYFRPSVFFEFGV